MFVGSADEKAPLSDQIELPHCHANTDERQDAKRQGCGCMRS